VEIFHEFYSQETLDPMTSKVFLAAFELVLGTTYGEILTPSAKETKGWIQEITLNLPHKFL
jgi:hypothetical protein